MRAESDPAPLLTLIVGPSEEARSIGRKKEELSERDLMRIDFWTQLLAKAKERTSLHASISPGRDSWLGTGAGKSGLAFNYVIHQHDTRIELYIDRGPDADDTERAYDKLLAHREEIEDSFGGPIKWDRLEGKRACRIQVDLESGGYRDTDRWNAIQDDMIATMILFSSALRPHIERLAI